MTENKPIMIDGVDVSGCKYLYIVFPDNKLDNESGCYAEGERCVKMTRCKNCHNCYFKQLQRKEQECEMLKKDRINIIKETLKIIENYNKSSKNLNR